MKALIRLLSWPYSGQPGVLIRGRSDTQYHFRRDRNRGGYNLVLDQSESGPDAGVISDKDVFNRVAFDLITSHEVNHLKLDVVPEIIETGPPVEQREPEAPQEPQPADLTQTPDILPPESDNKGEPENAQATQTEDEQPQSGSEEPAKTEDVEGTEGEGGEAEPEGESAEEPPETTVALEDMEEEELRQLAKDAKIPGYSRMKRETLIKRLTEK
jgi:hypothetical protein